MEVQVSASENGNSTMVSMETSSPALADPVGIAEFTRTALDGNHIGGVAIADDVEGPLPVQTAQPYSGDSSIRTLVGNGVDGVVMCNSGTVEDISLAGSTVSDALSLKAAASAAASLERMTAESVAVSASGSQRESHLPVSVPSSTRLMPANTVVIRSRATIEQLQHTVSLLEKEHYRLQQQTVAQGDAAVCSTGVTTTDEKSCSVSAGTVPVSPANSVRPHAMAHTPYVPCSSSASLAVSSALAQNQPVLAAADLSEGTSASLANVTRSIAAVPGAAASLPLMLNQMGHHIQTFGQSSAAQGMTSTSSSALPPAVAATGGANMPVLSFQQPFLVLPPMPPIDQQAVSHHTQVRVCSLPLLGCSRFSCFPPPLPLTLLLPPPPPTACFLPSPSHRVVHSAMVM